MYPDEIKDLKKLTVAMFFLEGEVAVDVGGMPNRNIDPAIVADGGLLRNVPQRPQRASLSQDR